jgi:hypothetical protein
MNFIYEKGSYGIVEVEGKYEVHKSWQYLNDHEETLFQTYVSLKKAKKAVKLLHKAIALESNLC